MGSNGKVRRSERMSSSSSALCSRGDGEDLPTSRWARPRKNRLAKQNAVERYDASVR
jgi:hypothetical protein